MIQSFIGAYKSYFSVEKVKKDLFQHLETSLHNTVINDEFVFEISEIDMPDITKEVRINKDDLLTILKFDSSYQFDADFYFFLTIGIGKFKARDENGIYGVEKCEALLKYNDDLSLYDVEFTYNEMYELDTLKHVVNLNKEQLK